MRPQNKESKKKTQNDKIINKTIATATEKKTQTKTTATATTTVILMQALHYKSNNFKCTQQKIIMRKMLKK